MQPKITVLMANYNNQRYLKQSIESILNQTYKNFDFLIIDDHSSDDSIKIIKSYSDKRIKLIKNHKNLGLTRSLNIGLKNINTEYIARMDADDISFPRRLKNQYDFLEKNTDVGILGSSCVNIFFFWE